MLYGPLRGAAASGEERTVDTTRRNPPWSHVAQAPYVANHDEVETAWQSAALTRARHTYRGVSWQRRSSGFVSSRSRRGKANPAPPVGTALGPQGINIMAFCKEFNARTQGQDTILPVEITIFADKSFTFITEDAARGGPAEEGGRDRQGIGTAEPQQGRERHQGAGP